MKHGSASFANFLVLATATVLPIFFLPMVVDPGNWQKRTLLAGVVGVMGVLWILQTLITKRARLTMSNATLFFFGFSFVTMVSALLRGNVLYQLSNFPLTWLILALFILLGTSLATSLRWHQVLRALFIPATILVIFAGLQFTPLALSEIFNRIFGTAFAKTVAFTPADSLLALLTFVIPVGLAGLLHTAEEEVHRDASGTYKVWSAILLLAGLGLGVVGLMNTATRPFILPWSSGWNIAVETLKTPATLMLGFGPNSFLNAFHQFRGLAFNNHDFWSVRFATSSSEMLFLLTTGGLLAIGMLFLMARSLWPMIQGLRARHFSLFVYVAIHALAFLALPFTPLLWFTTALGIMMVIREAQAMRHDGVWVWELPTSLRSPWLTPVISSALLAVVLGASGLLLASTLASNYVFGWSLKQGANANAQTVYDAQVRAMNFAPYHPEYRRAIASTSFAIIQAMSQQAQQSGTELTAEQQQLSLSLLQQAITQSRNAVALDPASTESWELLGNIYSNVLSVEGAPDWAVAARTQAIQTDPLNPQLRLALGQLYGQLNQPENALRFYENAVQLNPRWVQPYFAYGDTALAQKNGAAAAVAFQRTLELLDPTSPERPVVEDRLRAAQELAQQQAEEASRAAAAQAQQQQGQGQAQNPGQATVPTDGTTTPPTENLEVPTQPEQPATPEVDPQPSGFDQLL